MDDLPAQHNTGTTADPAGNPPAQPQIDGGTTIDPERERQSSKRKRDHKLHRAPIWIEAACALALVGITGFYTHYAKQQRDAILSGNWSSQQSANAATTAANAAASAASTADATLKASQQQFRMDERPYLTVSTNSGVTAITETKIITKSQHEYLKGETWQIYVVGGVQYRDIFQPRMTVPYETVYCFKIEMAGLPFANCAFVTSMK